MSRAIKIICVGVAGADVVYRCFVRPAMRKAIGYEPFPGERELEEAMRKWIS
jgi:hypothetical protein